VGISCSNNNAEEDNVLLLLKTLDNPFFESIKKGVFENWPKDSASPQIVARAGSKESDVSTQRQVLESFLNQYVQEGDGRHLRGVILTPSASNNELTGYIKRLNDHQVPVILVDTQIARTALDSAGAHYDVFIGSSNEQGGRLAADLIVKYAPAGGNILLLNGVDGHESAIARRKGFKDRLDELSKNYNIELTERTANWRRDEGRKTVEGLITLGHKIDAIFAANDEMALGAYEAVRTTPGAKNREMPIIIGFDAIDAAVQAVKDGSLTATIAQNPYGMGEAAVKSLSKIWKGEAVTKEQIISVQAVERE